MHNKAVHDNMRFFFIYQHLVCHKKWIEISYKTLQKDQGFTQQVSSDSKGSRDRTSPLFPPVKLQALQNYDISIFVAPYQSMVTPHTGVPTKKLVSLLVDGAQEKSRAQLTLSHLFPLFWITPAVVKIYFN